MAHNFAINDDVHHQQQGPQGRAVAKERSVYTIVSCLPIEADGRPRYRIKSKSENVERVVTEEQIRRLDLRARGAILPCYPCSATRLAIAPLRLDITASGIHPRDPCPCSRLSSRLRSGSSRKN